MEFIFRKHADLLYRFPNGLIEVGDVGMSDDDVFTSSLLTSALEDVYVRLFSGRNRYVSLTSTNVHEHYVQYNFISLDIYYPAYKDFISLYNESSQQKTIINAMAVNEEGVMVTGGDNGSMWFWDWKSGHNFLQSQTIVFH
ncbi:hypothetical protein MTR_2g436500 [Medicago truncatula]|uniref:Transcription factor WD40-like family n=1 Tax=Medicago truncatula TaxID=3880 RepID=A0A072V7A8_MEDTR|nr:hypothetical protein MTR_2g436500 [Medicago truncatula]